MAEKKLVIDDLTLSYSGILDMQDLLRKIKELLKQRGYEPIEKERRETVKKEGKDFFIELRPVKMINPSLELAMNIMLTATGIKSIPVKKAGRRIVLEDGDIKISFDAWVITDYEFKAETYPLRFLLKTLISKFLFKMDSEKIERELKEDVRFVHANILSYLELHRFLAKPLG